ncbi:MAG: TlpA disulfide reductase family protein [Chloroflexota bacterium]
MSEDTGTLPTPRPTRSFVRRVVYPVLVILAIVAVIWFIERQNSDNTNAGGQEFGIRDMNAHLNPNNLDVAADVGNLAPDFELETVAASGTPAINGEAWLSDYRGHPVVLNFWATWCRPCRQEIPEFVSAYDTYKSKGLVVIGLNLQEPGLIQPFAQQYGMDYPILVDRDGEVGDKYRLLGLPTTVFIDANGVIQTIYRGELQQNMSGVAEGAIDSSQLDAGLASIMPGVIPTGAASGSG